MDKKNTYLNLIDVYTLYYFPDAILLNKLIRLIKFSNNFASIFLNLWKAAGLI